MLVPHASNPIAIVRKVIEIGMCVVKSKIHDILLFHYEDGEKAGYIDVDARPPQRLSVSASKETITVRASLGNWIIPEAVKSAYLSEEQLSFFKSEYPSVYARFSR